MEFTQANLGRSIVFQVNFRMLVDQSTPLFDQLLDTIDFMNIELCRGFLRIMHCGDELSPLLQEHSSIRMNYLFKSGNKVVPRLPSSKNFSYTIVRLFLVNCLPLTR